MDTDNAGFNISNNYISDNYAEGLIYEISYNAVIRDNILVHNGVGAGPNLQGFPEPALYISESGGDSRVASKYSGEFDVTGNIFTNDWGGVVLWEDSNRHCGDGYDGRCTLVTPATYTITSCTAHLPGSTPLQRPDYYNNCRWKTQNVTVSGNVFNLTPAAVGPSCTEANWCGFNGLFSEYGTTTPWKAWTVPLHISDTQNNHFTNNTYRGPWRFDNEPILGMTANHDGTGYRLAAYDGGIFTFGAVNFYGSMGGHPLNAPVVGMATTADNGGYWEVARDGGIFTFGDAQFHGSRG